AAGGVQSAIFRGKSGSQQTPVPVFASANTMVYRGEQRVVRYDMDVNIRQGSDKIEGSAATINLDDKNEISTFAIEGKVLITRPGQKAAADYAHYAVNEDKITLRGNPARVDDAAKGSTQGAELVLYQKDRRVVSDGRTIEDPEGRVRTVYKVQ
ncbi:MAG: LptA/OstA family protein, partial [Pyrinomonadaceae bacterium]